MVATSTEVVAWMHHCMPSASIENRSSPASANQSVIRRSETPSHTVEYGHRRVEVGSGRHPLDHAFVVVVQPHRVPVGRDLVGEGLDLLRGQPGHDTASTWR